MFKLMKPERLNLLWWIGVPILNFLYVFVPLWVWQYGALDGEGWMRISVLPSSIFDFYSYLYWMSAAAESMHVGHLLYWFAWILPAIWKAIGSWASYAELWLITRWITTTLSLWIFAVVVREFSGLKKWPARVTSLGLFLSFIIVLGQRPGIYSWYLPFTLLGIIAAWRAVRALREQKPKASIPWTILSFILSSIYPWTFLVVGLWLITNWSVWLIRKSKGSFFILLTAIIALTAIVASTIAERFLEPDMLVRWTNYTRLEIGLTRLPFFSNTIIAITLWIGFMFSVLRRMHFDSETRNRLFQQLWIWIVIFFCWFHSTFTGVFTFNDHFMLPAVLFAWISLGVLWKALEENVVMARRERTNLFDRLLDIALPFVTIFATLFFLYIIQKPFRLHFLKFYSYLIHLTLWFALMTSAWIVTLRRWKSNSLFPHRALIGTIVAVSFLLGACGSIGIYSGQARQIENILNKREAAAWIRDNIPLESDVCSDPRTAEFFTAHTARRFHPTEGQYLLPREEEEILRDLETLAGAYDIQGAEDEPQFLFFAVHYRANLCEKGRGAKHALHYRIMKRLGIDDETAYHIMGCPNELITEIEERMTRAIRKHEMNEGAFRGLCPWVVIPNENQGLWSLPDDYEAAYEDDVVRIWKKR